MEFWPTLDVASATASVTAKGPPFMVSPSEAEEYLAGRDAPIIKKETAVPTELPEVVNLARDYDRWDHYEAPPPLED